MLEIIMIALTGLDRWCLGEFTQRSEGPFAGRSVDVQDNCSRNAACDDRQVIVRPFSEPSAELFVSWMSVLIVLPFDPRHFGPCPKGNDGEPLFDIII